MKAIIGGRGTGRTHELIKQASRNNGVFVCHNRNSIRINQEKAITMYMKGEIKIVPEIVCIQDLKGIRTEKELYIDNLEMSLYELFKIRVGGVVMDDSDGNVNVVINTNGTQNKTRNERLTELFMSVDKSNWY